MRMLDNLKERLDEIGRVDEWSQKFIEDLLIKKEEDPTFKLSPKQFKKVDQIHQKWCL